MPCQLKWQSHAKVPTPVGVQAPLALHGSGSQGSEPVQIPSAGRHVCQLAHLPVGQFSVAQSAPDHPASQAQTADPVEFEQIPPLRQGLPEQGSATQSPDELTKEPEGQVAQSPPDQLSVQAQAPSSQAPFWQTTPLQGSLSVTEPVPQQAAERVKRTNDRVLALVENMGTSE